jgi:hypothetical protein
MSKEPAKLQHAECCVATATLMLEALDRCPRGLSDDIDRMLVNVDNNLSMIRAHAETIKRNEERKTNEKS